MEFTFKNGNYDQHLDMVNSSRELLDESILLRNVQDKIDSKIDSIKSSGSNNYDHLFWLLSIPLLLILTYINYKFFISWRILPLLLLICFGIYYKISSNKETSNRNNVIKDSHDDGPRPLKYLEMKLNYLGFLMDSRHTSLKNIRFFYMVLFPFLGYFAYEAIMTTTPFNNALVGLAVSLVLSCLFWYFYFNSEFDKMWFHKKQLKDYRSLISEHKKSLLPITEEE